MVSCTIQVLFTTGDMVCFTFSGYTEVNLGLCSGHLQLHWLVFVQAAEGFDVCEVPHISWSGKSILAALIP